MKVNMYELLSDLQQTNAVRVTGSFADGTQTEDSDIDFQVTGDIDKITAVLDKHKIKWTTHRRGCAFTHESRNPGLLTELEFHQDYQHREGCLPTVRIEGVEFKTW